MSEPDNKETSEANVDEAPIAPKLKIINQFVKDLSFENVAAEKNFKLSGRPIMNMNVGLNAIRDVNDKDQYSIMTKISIISKTEDDNKIFAVELEYIGVIKVENIDDDKIHPFVYIEGSRMFFPFIRRIISDVSRDGGFPPVNLEPIDYVDIYRKMIQQKQASVN